MRTKSSDTEKLIAGLRRGDRRAHIEAMNRYGRLISSVVGAMASDPRDAEELTQDAFIRAFGAINRFDGKESKFSTWLARIAYHAAVDHLRRLGVKPAEDVTDTPPEPEAEEADMMPELLDEALELIAPEERTTLQLVYFDGMSLDEAAYVLDTNANALSTRLYRIRNKLARIINELQRKQ